MRNAYLGTLYELAEKDKNVLSLVSDNGMIVYDDFREKFPNQYFNFGISEGHMVAAAAGMASCGKIPFAYTIGSFLAYRSYEFIRVDVCLQNLNVKIVGIGAGVSYGYLGPTHHTTEDIAVLRSLPNLTLFSPACASETRAVIKAAYEIKGPVYIRLGTNNETELYEKNFEFEQGRGSIVKEGKDIVFICTGSITYDALQAAILLEREGISVKVISMHTIKPFDKELVIKSANNAKAIFTVEEHNIIGGLGSAVAEVLTENRISIHFHRIGLQDKFAAGYGNHQDVKLQNHLDVRGIYNTVMECTKHDLKE